MRHHEKGVIGKTAKRQKDDAVSVRLQAQARLQRGTFETASKSWDDGMSLDENGKKKLCTVVIRV